MEQYLDYIILLWQIIWAIIGIFGFGKIILEAIYRK